MQVQKPLQGRVWKMLAVNTLTCGLGACMAAETVYIPPLLLEAGMEKRYMSLVLGKFIHHTHSATYLTHIQPAYTAAVQCVRSVTFNIVALSSSDVTLGFLYVHGSWS